MFAKDSVGHTTLHLAARGENVNMIRILLEKGLEPSAKAGNGHTPADMTDNEEIKHLLREAAKH